MNKIGSNCLVFIFEFPYIFEARVLVENGRFGGAGNEMGKSSK